MQKTNYFASESASPSGNSLFRTWRLWLVASFLLAINAVFAQTDRIPIAEGAFSNPGGFAGNNWSVSNGATPNHQWIVSSGHALGAPFSGNAAFVSNDGTAYAYTPANNSNIFFWRDVTVPALEPVMQLTFDWNQQGENTWDLWQVFVAPTTITPAGNNTHPGSGTTNVPAPIAGATYIGNGSVIAGIQSFTGTIPASFAGTTFRLIFSWKNEVGGTQPPAAIDNIRLTSAAPTTFTATAQGGLWNSPATWVGGVVPPAGNDVVIPAGSTVTVNQVLNYRDITVNGNLHWGGTFAATASRDVIVGAGGNLFLSTAAAAGQTLNIGRDLINDGSINASAASAFINFNGTGNSQISGSGTFVGTGGRGIIRTLGAQNNGTFTLNQTQNITLTNQVTNTCNNFVTNGKMRLDNAVDVFQSSVSQVITTAMGTGYTTAPVVLGEAVSPWVASGTALLGTRYFSGTNVYICTTAGTFDASTPPSNTTPVTEINGTATVLWVGNLGNLGNSFRTHLTSTAGVQFYCGDNLYTCTVTGTASAAAPPTHTSGTAVSGTATFAYVGTVAKASLNYDAVTQTVRSLNLVSAGSGYSSIPPITISNTGAGSGATASSVMYQVAGPANSTATKATASTFTGATDTRHSAAPAGAAGNGVYSATTATYGWYNSVPEVGFSLPPLVNLMASQGVGYTSLPTITVTGGTLISGTAVVSADIQLNIADGRLISAYYTGAATKIYSVPPTITLSGGGAFVQATLSWGTAMPTATVNLSNGTSGFVTGINITNNGYGYATAPSVALRATVLGETAATLPSCRLQQMNLQWGFFAPQTTNPNNNSIMQLVPSNNRINGFVVTSGAQTFTTNIEATAAAPLPTFAGVIDMGGSNNLRFSHPDYTGTAGTLNAFVTNGTVELSFRGGNTASATRTFPIGGGAGATSQFVHVTGLGTATTGFTYTGMRVQRFNSPTGSVSPGGNLTGIRGVRADLTGTGTLTNLNTGRTMQMFWNVLDNLVSDNPSIFLADATSASGPWTVRSIAGVAGPLGTTGSRTTASVAPGPYANNTSMFFAWVNNGFTPPAGLAYNVTRTTGNTYTSIASVAKGGNGTGVALTGWATSIGNDEEQATINLPTWGNTFQGQTITGVRVHTNGFLQIITTGTTFPTNPWDNSMARTDAPNVVAAFWEDLVNKTTGGNNRDNSIIHNITGSSPNRILTVEWANLSVFGAADAAQLYFQVQLFENTGEIRINYGDNQLFNGTIERRYSYSCGIKGRYNTAYPTAGQVFAQQYENYHLFGHTRTQTAHLGANGLAVSPEPRSSLSFLPGVYVAPGLPPITPPANDEVASAEVVTSLSVFPSNVAWNVPDNKSRIYTTRFATSSTPANCGGGPANQRDAWFQFDANEVNVTVRVYPSGGYIPRIQVFDNISLTTSIACVVGTQGLQTDAVLTGLTVGQTYYVRVSHDRVGTPATFTTSAVASGNLSGLSIVGGGTNYTSAPATFNGPTGLRMDATGGGGSTFVGAVTTVTGGVVTGGTFDGGNDYTSIPTITVEDPNWGISGDFALVVYAPPINDDCSGAIALTSIGTNNCVTSSNQLLGITSSAATPSSETLGSCSVGADDDLWYTFTATGTLTNIRVQGNSGYNPALQIWSGTSCGAKAVVSTPAGGCLNATGIDAVEEVLLSTTIGTQYWVRVYHAGTGSGTFGANFDICVTTPTPACASGFNIADGATVCGGSATTISWSATPFATAYDIFFDGLDGSTQVVNDTAATAYNAGVLPAGTYYYNVVPLNANGSAIGCVVRSFVIISPTPTSTSPATRCGTGTVTLGATGTNLQWWDAPTAGTLLGSGPSFTTPTISATTNYYASAGVTSAGSVPIGVASTTTSTSGITPFTTFWESQGTHYLYRVSELSAAGLFAGNLTALSFNVTTLGGTTISNMSIRIAHTSATSLSGYATNLGPETTVFSAASYTVVSGVNTFTFSTPFNWNGTDNIYVEICNDTNPFASSSTVSANTTSFNSVYAEYDDGIDICSNPGVGIVISTFNIRPLITFSGQTLCAGPRTLVTATVTPPPALTISSASEAYCAGGSTSPISVTSTIGDFDTYVWAPASGVSGGSTGPWTFNPSVSTNYTLTATQTGGSECVNTTGFNVTVNPLPPAGTLNFTANPVCEGTNTVLNANGFAGTVNILSQNFESGLSGWSITAASTGGANPLLGNFRVVAHNAPAEGTTGRIFNSPGGTNLLLSHSDAAGSGQSTNTQFTSPVFAISPLATAATISFRHHVNGAIGTLNIQVSTDGGTTWSPTPLASYTTTIGTLTAFTTTNVSLASVIGQSNIRIRFNVVSGWGWWWAIDDIAITQTLPAMTSYEWSGPDSYTAGPSAPATQTRPSAQLSHEGVYTVIATDGNGCTRSASSAALDVQPTTTAALGGSPLPAPGAAFAAISCDNGTITIGTSPGTRPVDFQNYASVNWTVFSSPGVTTTITGGATTENPTVEFSGSITSATTVVLRAALTRVAPCTGTLNFDYEITLRPTPNTNVLNNLLVPAPTAICNDANGVSRQLNILSPDAGTDYIWSPAADLYVDPSFSTPYTGGPATTLYTVPFGAVNYSITATNTTSGCTTDAHVRALTVCPALTDGICGADLVAPLPVTTTGAWTNISLLGSTLTGGIPCTPVNRDIFLRVIVPASGEIHVTSAPGTNANPNLNVQRTMLSIHYGLPSGGTCTTSPSIACNFGGAAGDHSYVFATGLVPGTTAYIRIARATADLPTAQFLRIAVTSGLYWTGSFNNNFSDARNYLGGDATALTFPDATKGVFIRNQVNQPVVSSVSSARSLEMVGTAFLSINTGNTLSVPNRIVANTNTIGGAGFLVMNGTSAQTLGSPITINNLRVNNGSGVNVTVPTVRVGALDLQSGVVNSGGNLNIISTASVQGYINNFSPGYSGSISGNVNIERRTVSSGLSSTHYISMPATNALTVQGNYNDDFSVVGSPAGYVFSSDPTAPQPNPFPTTWWFNETLTSPFTPGWTNAVALVPATGQGISATIPGTRTIDVSGTANNAPSYSRAVTFTDDGFNLIGNPYPSPIVFDNFYTANSSLIANGFYIWNPAIANYAIYNGVSATWTNNPAGASSSSNIAHSQSFIVVANASGSVTFNSTMRTTTQAATFFSEPSNIVKLSVSNAGRTDETIIALNADASDEYDNMDSKKLLTAPDKMLSMFTLSKDNMPLAINLVNNYNTDKRIPLQVVAVEGGEATISLANINTIREIDEVYLEDASLNKFVNLKAVGSYKTNVSEGNSGNRFFLHFAAPSTRPQHSDIMSIYANDDKVFVNIPEEGNTQIEVMNILGQNVVTVNATQFKGLKEISVPNVVTGTYLVKVTNGGNVTTEKVVLTGK